MWNIWSKFITSFLGAVFYIFIASREIKRGGAVEK